ncbi:hypothetical protein DYBT9275_01910 [Dyadobacter sp. CECT 9275]|uniref:Uncharacterized protein n=1 Tax=Dyadobacter helix TaxID=2822344 RepID=A0A916NBH3_9BACT|nr:hypothetical protein DYBT9275_01910 [Dyadobacter sp. CECT 9275]
MKQKSPSKTPRRLFYGVSQLTFQGTEKQQPGVVHR